MKKQQSGFTLIELMIVVAIIGILAAVAIPQYQNYTARSNIAAAVAAISSTRTGLEEFALVNGVFPNGTAGAVTADPTTTPPTAAFPSQRPGDLGITQPTNGTITLTQGTANTDAGYVIFTFGAGPAGVNGNEVRMLRATGGGWSCETTIDAELVGSACTTVNAYTAL